MSEGERQQGNKKEKISSHICPDGHLSGDLPSSLLSQFEHKLSHPKGEGGSLFYSQPSPDGVQFFWMVDGVALPTVRQRGTKHQRE